MFVARFDRQIFLLFVKNGFVVGVPTLNATATSATPPLSHCHAWPLCPCHAGLGANNTVQRVNSWMVGGTQAVASREGAGNYRGRKDGGKEGAREGG